MEKSFIITRVATRHFISDFFQTIRNMFGLRLRSYEELIKVTHAEMIKEMRVRYGNNIQWYRISFNPLGEKSVMINLYGELK